MSLETWDWFIEIVHAGNLTRAAEELDIKQQTLSARLATLEKELGAKLVLRKTPLSLTPAGEAFYAFAVDQQEASQRMQRRVSEASEGESGVLKIAISNMRGRIMMPAVISEFHKGFPGVRIELIEGTNEELLGLAERGEVDIVVARFDRSHPGITARSLFEEEVVLAVHPRLLEEALGVSAEEAVARVETEGLSCLHTCPFLLEEDDDLAGRIGRAELKKARIKHEGVVKCESMAILLGLAAEGLGAVFCPVTMLNDAAGLTKDLCRIHLKDTERYQISIGRPADAEAWTPAQAFEDTLGALFGE